MLKDELRPVRLQLELLKPELIQQKNGIESTVVIFGSTRIPDAQTATECLHQAKNLASKKTSDSILARKVNGCAH